MKNHAPNIRVAAARAERGFTLVELMVAIAVGLVLTLAITGTVLTMGRQFRIVGSNISAQGGAQIALSLIDSAGREAGAGLFSNGRLLCPKLNAWKDGAIKSNGDVFLPARITDGGSDTASDTIVFSASTATGSLGVMPLVAAMAGYESSVLVSAGGVIQDNELALIGSPGSDQPCTLFQMTDPPVATSPAANCGNKAISCQSLPRVGDAAGYNPVDPATTFGANARRYGFDADMAAVPPIYGRAVVSRMGTEFRQEAFQVQCDALVQFNAFLGVPAGCTTNPLSFPAGANALATDVVLMHAQYGVSASADSNVVTNWVDASGATWGATITAANAEKIKAVRVVIVVRSKEPGTGTVTAGSCDNGKGVTNVGPCSFIDADAPKIDLSAVAVPSGRSWQNYSYRVHQAVIPLRNVIWNKPS